MHAQVRGIPAYSWRILYQLREDQVFDAPEPYIKLSDVDDSLLQHLDALADAQCHYDIPDP